MKRLFVIAAFLMVIYLIAASTAIKPPQQGEIYTKPLNKYIQILTFLDDQFLFLYLTEFSLPIGERPKRREGPKQRPQEGGEKHKKTCTSKYQFGSW